MSSGPPKGSMYLYDYLTPPLSPDSYRVHVSTDVHYKTEHHTLDGDHFFNVVGPRFNLAATEVAGVYPPRNGHGPFSDVLPQIALKRRTLPWERAVEDPQHPPIGNPSGGLPSGYPLPWLALLLFEEGEYTLLQGVPLESVVPASAYNLLGKPQNILCDAVEADASLIADILPSKEELQLLTHVRQVNIEDRELSVEGSDGWFAIVMGSRLPTPGAKCRACLVSLEKRVDLVKKDPPPSYVPDAPPPISPPPRDIEQLQMSNVSGQQRAVGIGILPGLQPATTRLVLLHSWQFVCDGTADFFDLMQNLDVGMFGKTDAKGKPEITDTGHIKLELHDRAGTTEKAFYRGPLVQFPLTRDPLVPYHSADQARRVGPEAGVEDVSYAAAFEAGRLLAASDARLAQELMRWRRESYQQGAVQHNIASTQNQIALDLPLDPVAKLHTPITLAVSTAAITRMVKGSGPIADPYGMKSATQTPAYTDSAALADAWGLASPEAAKQIMSANPGTLGVPVEAPAQTPRPDLTLDQVISDTGSMQRLSTARDRVVENAKVRTGH